MRRISLGQVTAGLRLAMPIYNERGEVLLRSNITLTDNYISLLQRKRCSVLWVHDDDTTDISVFDILSERLRGQASLSIANALSATQASIEEVQGSTPEEKLKFLRSEGFKKSVSAFPAGALERVADSVTEEVLGASALASLFSAIRLGDTYLHAHLLDTTVTSLMLGRRVQLDRGSLRRLAVGCLLHDIGMMLINPVIVSKLGGLTQPELAEMRQHTTLGFALLETIHRDRLANTIALQHHEWQDGSGYPRGLTGSNQIVTSALNRQTGQMMLWAEVVAVADVFDALASDRPYRPQIPPEDLPNALRSIAGTHLNAKLVDLFLEMVPPYPLGTEVVVTKGPVAGCRGVVARLDANAPLRPVIRLLYGRTGERIRPAEIDLHRSRSIEICSQARLARMKIAAH